MQFVRGDPSRCGAVAGRLETYATYASVVMFSKACSTPMLVCCQQNATAGDAAFDMASNTRLRGGHAGPVTRLSLTDQLLCSASLDFTARLWKRGPEMRCAAVLHLSDWVWDIAARRVGPYPDEFAHVESRRT